MSLPSSPKGRDPTARDSVDHPGDDDNKLSLIEMLSEMNKLESPSQQHQHHLTKYDISNPSLASGPTFVETEGSRNSQPEEIRKRV